MKSGNVRPRLARPRLAVLLMVSLAAAASVVAAAEPQPRPQGQAQGGPLALQPIESGFFVMPEVKITKVDGSAASFIGGTGGWIFGGVFMLGAGAYSMVGGRDDVDMHYGGLVAGFQWPAGETVRFGARALVGFGNARLIGYLPCAYPTGDFAPCFEPVGLDVGFSVFDPQASALVRLNRKWTLDLGGGYRVIADAGGLENRLRGGFGSIAMRFGPF